MQCYHPLRAWQRGTAAPLFSMPAGGGYRVLELPCGQCVGCRLERSREWASRCVHEAQMHEENCSITLTYDDAHLPADLSLRHRDFQLFMKRLRKSAPTPLSYFMCGEYGEENSRPHYHAILFGYNPGDRCYWRTSDAGFKCYTSKVLDSIWQKGAVYVGDVSFESCAYVARYTLKKVGSDGKVREILDVSTGEVVTRSHEYGKMSLRPALGKSWFTRYFSDVYPHDRVIVRGSKNRVPRYYDKLLESLSPLYLASLKAKRVDAGRARAAVLLESLSERERFTDEKRLKVHEVVKLASLRLLHRS